MEDKHAASNNTKAKTLVMSNNLTREKKRQHQLCISQDWSKLVPDVLRKILESLNVFDFNQAKTVCSDWYSVWRTCMKPTRYPWRFIYLRNGSSMIFDPKEGKSYDTKLLGLDFSDDSFCLTTSGNWFLMVDPRIDFYLLNVLTRKRINLPSFESSIRGGQARFHRTDGGCGGYLSEPTRKDFLSKSGIVYYTPNVSVLSIDEKTNDYFVALLFKKHYLFTHKKGDDSWWNFNKGTDLKILDLAYGSNKLYLLYLNFHIRIIDFSRDLSKVENKENPYQNYPFRYIWHQSESLRKTKIALRNSGEVLIIWSLKRNLKKLFYVFKMNFESKKWEKIKSIGDNEMLIFGHGSTIRAPVKEVGDGFKSDSICFVEDDDGLDGWLDDWLDGSSSNCGVFDLATNTITISKRFGDSVSRWFVPG